MSDQDETLIAQNLDRLFDLQRYPFTALEIAPTVDEEQVADIFVRINSEGVKLNQADFILTLLSVFWENGRKELESFSRASHVPVERGAEASPFNHFIQPGPDQLLRVAVAVGFMRGRLKSVYQVLRGKDLETGSFPPSVEASSSSGFRKHRRGSENLEISDKPPREYVPLMRARFSDEDWKRMCQMHALPDGWETMGYESSWPREGR